MYLVIIGIIGVGVAAVYFLYRKRHNIIPKKKGSDPGALWSTKNGKELLKFRTEPWNVYDQWLDSPGNMYKEMDKPVVDPYKERCPNGYTRFVCVADTDTGKMDMDQMAKAFKALPWGHVLIHTGNFSRAGHVTVLAKFNQALGQLKHEHKIVIAGNHEISLDKYPHTKLFTGQPIKQFHAYRPEENPGSPANAKAILTNCTFLEDSEVKVRGFRIYGSPWHPITEQFGAFTAHRGEAILKKWKKIPDGIDILMTPGAPFGHGDGVQFYGTNVTYHCGCMDLLSEVQTRVKPKIHVFGTCDKGVASSTDGVTYYFNSASDPEESADSTSFKYFVFDLPDRKVKLI
eukprot:scpid76472/ scgid17150/ Metallophosphoesterase domain-containing protein 1; Adult brain protein 239